MKAAKSNLAQRLLADPRAREQLLKVSSQSGRDDGKPIVIEVTNQGRRERYTAEVVARAA